jgi:hypothetical protein
MQPPVVPWEANEESHGVSLEIEAPGGALLLKAPRFLNAAGTPIPNPDNGLGAPQGTAEVLLFPAQISAWGPSNRFGGPPSVVDAIDGVIPESEWYRDPEESNGRLGRSASCASFLSAARCKALGVHPRNALDGGDLLSPRSSAFHGVAPRDRYVPALVVASDLVVLGKTVGPSIDAIVEKLALFNATVTTQGQQVATTLSQLQSQVLQLQLAINTLSSDLVQAFADITLHRSRLMSLETSLESIVSEHADTRSSHASALSALRMNQGGECLRAALSPGERFVLEQYPLTTVNSYQNLVQRDSNTLQIDSVATLSSGLPGTALLGLPPSWTASSAGLRLHSTTVITVPRSAAGPIRRHAWLYVTGGQYPQQSVSVDATAEAWRMDLVSLRWERVPDMLKPRMYHTCGWVSELGYVLCGGGQHLRAAHTPSDLNDAANGASQVEVLAVPEAFEATQAASRPSKQKAGETSVSQGMSKYYRTDAVLPSSVTWTPSHTVYRRASFTVSPVSWRAVTNLKPKVGTFQSSGLTRAAMAIVGTKAYFAGGYIMTATTVQVMKYLYVLDLAFSSTNVFMGSMGCMLPMDLASPTTSDQMPAVDGYLLHVSQRRSLVYGGGSYEADWENPTLSPTHAGSSLLLEFNPELIATSSSSRCTTWEVPVSMTGFSRAKAAVIDGSSLVLAGAALLSGDVPAAYVVDLTTPDALVSTLPYAVSGGASLGGVAKSPASASATLIYGSLVSVPRLDVGPGDQASSSNWNGTAQSWLASRESGIAARTDRRWPFASQASERDEELTEELWWVGGDSFASSTVTTVTKLPLNRVGPRWSCTALSRARSAIMAQSRLELVVPTVNETTYWI